MLCFLGSGDHRIFTNPPPFSMLIPRQTQRKKHKKILESRQSKYFYSALRRKSVESCHVPGCDGLSGPDMIRTRNSVSNGHDGQGSEPGNTLQQENVPYMNACFRFYFISRKTSFTLSNVFGILFVIQSAPPKLPTGPSLFQHLIS